MDGNGVSDTAHAVPTSPRQANLPLREHVQNGTSSQSPSKPTQQKKQQQRKKRTSPPAANSSASQQAFHFVDGTSSSKEKRSHVMRHHLKEKKEKGRLTKQQKGKQGGKPSTGYILPWTKKNEIGSSPTGDPISCSLAIPAQTSPTTSITLPVNPTSSPPLPISLTTRLSAARKDPFNTLPLSLDTNGEHELIAYWTSRLAYWSGENNSMKDAVFRRAMQHPLTFQVVILTYCARYKDRCYGVTESDESKLHITRARDALDSYVRDGNDPQDDNMAMAIAALSLQEERYGNKEVAVRDIENVRQMMRPRLGRNNVTEIFVHFVHYLTVSPLDRPVDSGVVCPLHNLLRLAEGMMNEHRDMRFLSLVPERHGLFQIGTTLHQLLSSGPRPTQVSPENHRWVLKDHPIPEACRTAALLYITMGLYDCHGSVDKCRRFLRHLTRIIDERGLNHVPAVESFIWFLIEERWQIEDGDLRNPARPTAVGDALKNLKILGPELQFHYAETLLGFLMLTTPVMSLATFESGVNRINVEGKVLMERRWSP